MDIQHGQLSEAISLIGLIWAFLVRGINQFFRRIK